MRKGFFISLEGVDGVGKTSVLEELKKRNLANVSIFKTLSVNEEYSNEYGAIARKMLHNKNFDAREFALLCILDMRLLYRDYIQPLLKIGIDVYVDRWFYSTMTYFAEQTGINELELLEFNAFLVHVLKLPSPDVIAMLFCDFSVSLERIQKRSEKMDVLEKKLNETRLAKLYGIYYSVLDNSRIPVLYLNTEKTKTPEESYFVFDLKMKDHLSFYYGIPNS